MADSIRLVEAKSESELAGFGKVWSDVYGAENFDAQSAVPTTYFLGLVGDDPAFATSIESYQYSVRGTWLKTAQVGGVATLGQYRVGGVGTTCLQLLDSELVNRGFEIGCLYGFRDPFYRRVGYASCGWRWEIRCEAHQMPKWPVQLPVRQLEASAASKLNSCYEAFISGFNGSALRGEGEWKRRLGRRPPVIYALGDPVEAYFWTTIEGFWNKLEIGEFAWSTPRGYESAIGLIRGMAINKKSVKWHEPVSSPFIALGMDSTVEAELDRSSMFRLIDPAGVLNHFESRFTKGVTLEVSGFDAQDMIRRIEVAGGGPSVGLNIQTLTQGVMGMPGFDELDRFGLLYGDRGGIEILIDALPAQPVTCMEFF